MLCSYPGCHSGALDNGGAAGAGAGVGAGRGRTLGGVACVGACVGAYGWLYSNRGAGKTGRCVGVV